MKFNAENIKLNTPNQIGFVILDKAKKVLYDFFYDANKGVPYSKQRNLTHDKFKKIYQDEIENISMDVISIISTKCDVRTVMQNKRCLSKIDDKRYYINKNKTVAYGHPALIKNEATLIKKRKAVTQVISNLDREMDLTMRKRAKGEMMFNKNT